MAFPYLAVAYGIYLGGKYAYHRWDEWANPPVPPRPDDLKVPTTDQGTPIQLLYGRCLVRQPIVAWVGNAQAIDVTGLGVEALMNGARFLYTFDAMFVLGIGFHNGNQSIHTMRAGGSRLYDVGVDTGTPYGPYSLEELTGDGDYSSYARLTSADSHPTIGVINGNLEFFNGKPTQALLDGSLTPTTHAAERMIAAGVPDWSIPAHRGFMSVFLWQDDAIDEPTDRSWYHGSNTTPHAYSFDVSSYLTGFSPDARIGDDCNPVIVIEDLLTGGFGKLGLPTSLIDGTSFAAAAATLADEEHGYSRCIDERREASEIINEILEQIDAVLYEDFRDGLDGSIRIKLIRADYDPTTIPHITPANCEAVENFAITSMSDAVNVVRVVFTDRLNDYADGEATAMDGAIITASGEGPIEAVLRYPGVCTKELAEEIAARELGARGQPIARCSVIVDSTFKDVNPGDALRLSWPEYHLNQRVFRVAQADRGTLTDGRIRLDLVQDFFYIYRRVVHPGGPVTPFPTPDLPAIEE